MRGVLVEYLAALAILLVSVTCKSSKTQPEYIQLSLTRQQIPAWTTNNTQSANSICVAPKYQKKSYASSIMLPVNCSKTPVVKIVQNCILKNLAYTAKVYFGDPKKTSAFNLQLDLMSPWSWVKSPVCQTCMRDGESCQQDSCPTGGSGLSSQPSSSAGEQNHAFTTTYACEKPCQALQRCGEIDLFAEGLSVVGQFVETQLRLEGVTQRIKGHKVLWAHAVSGQNFLKADGALGLGQEFVESDQDDQAVNEQGTSIVGQVVKTFDPIENKLFAVFIAESTNDLPLHVDIGRVLPEYIHNAQSNVLQWVNVMDNSEDDSDYFLWKMPIFSMNVKTIKSEKDINDVNIVERTVDLQSRTAILSLSNTALVLPQTELKELLDIFQSIYQISCKIESKYLYFVTCYNLSQPFEFNDISIIIKVGDNQVPLYVDPHYLVQNCRPSSSSSSQQQGAKNTKKPLVYECILNLQKSYNDVTILGEAALRNSYVVFDQDNKKIGIAAARNKYNEGLFFLIEEKIEEIGTEIAYDLIFIFRFCVVIFLLLLALCSFKYMNFIIEFIERICNRRAGNNSFSRSFNKNNNNSNNKLVEFTNIPSSDVTVNTNRMNNSNNNISEIQHEQIKEKIEELSTPQNLEDL